MERSVRVNVRSKAMLNKLLIIYVVAFNFFIFINNDATAAEQKIKVKDIIKTYKELAADGSGPSAMKLGDIYREGKLVKQDYNLALKYYKIAAERDMPEANYNIHLMYKKGLGVKKDLKKSFEYLFKAANLNNSEYKCFLALAYAKGRGVKQNFIKAEEWYIKAMQGDFSPAFNNLALLYKSGKLGDEKKELVENLFLIAAEKKFPLALCNLAYQWASEKRNLQKAKSFIEEALSQEPEKACFIDTYGFVLYNLENYEDAVKQYLKAIEINKNKSIYRLHLVNAYLALGEVKLASEELQKYNEIKKSLSKDENE